MTSGAPLARNHSITPWQNWSEMSANASFGRWCGPGFDVDHAMVRFDQHLGSETFAVGAGEGDALDTRLRERRHELADVDVHPAAVARPGLQQRRRVERDDRNASDATFDSLRPRRRSVGQQRVDVRFAVAVATDELGAQCVELVEARTAIPRHPLLELRDRIGERPQAVLVEFFDSTEVMLGADRIELDRQRVVAEVLGWARRAGRARP